MESVVSTHASFIGLVARSITHTYRNRSGVSIRFRNLDVRIAPGEIVCILGRSGVGKSTFLRILAGLITKPELEGGNVYCDGSPLLQPHAPVALVLQDYQNAVFPWLTVRRNLELGHFKSNGSSDGFFTAEHAARIVEIDKHIDEYTDKLSGGQVQRVQIGRALVSRIQYLLLDEPDSSVDADLRQDMRKILLGLVHETGLGIVWVTHNIEEAAYLADNIYLMTSERPPDVTMKSLRGFGHQGDYIVARENVTFREMLKCINQHLFGDE